MNERAAPAIDKERGEAEAEQRVQPAHRPLLRCFVLMKKTHDFCMQCKNKMRIFERLAPVCIIFFRQLLGSFLCRSMQAHICSCVCVCVCDLRTLLDSTAVFVAKTLRCCPPARTCYLPTHSTRITSCESVCVYVCVCVCDFM